MEFEDIETGLEKLSSNTLILTLTAIREELFKRGVDIDTDESTGLNYEENRFFIQKIKAYNAEN